MPGLFSAIAVVKNGPIRHHFSNFHSLLQLQLLIVVICVCVYMCMCVCVGGAFKVGKTSNCSGHDGSFLDSLILS